MSKIYQYDPALGKVVLVKDDFASTTFHDVYFDKPGFHHGISDPKTGNPIFVTSRSHKATLMHQYNLQERGDRMHGARNFDPTSHRYSVESLRRSHS